MLTAKLILERFDKDHRLLERREQPSRSFLKNFISFLYIAHAQIVSASPYSMTDVDGNARNVDGETSSTTYIRFNKANLKIGAPPGDSQIIASHGYELNAPIYWLRALIEGQKVGIQVGTGVTAVTPTDTALATRIPHGRAAGQLEYGGCELINIAFVNPNGEFTIRRYLTNASGGSITVNEAGIYAVGSNIGVGVWAFLIARDLVSPGVAVANTELLKVTYVPQVTV